MHLPIFSRPITATPYDRFPSDRFLVPDFTAEVIGAPVILVFGCLFMFAWNFSFPSPAEKILWRICSTYILSYTFVGGVFIQYCHKILLPRCSDHRRGLLPFTREKSDFLPERLRNIQQDRNPGLDIPLRALVLVTVLCALYCICRGYILVEDIISLRKLPESAYQTVNWSVYIPHW